MTQKIKTFFWTILFVIVIGFVIFSISGEFLQGRLFTSRPVSCKETDGGNEIYTAGTISVSNNRYNDTCVQAGKQITEYWCDKSSTGYKSETKNCEYGCVNGACLKEIVPKFSVESIEMPGLAFMTEANMPLGGVKITSNSPNESLYLKTLKIKLDAKGTVVCNPILKPQNITGYLGDNGDIIFDLSGASVKSGGSVSYYLYGDVSSKTNGEVSFALSNIQWNNDGSNNFWSSGYNLSLNKLNIKLGGGDMPNPSCYGDLPSFKQALETTISYLPPSETYYKTNGEISLVCEAPCEIPVELLDKKFGGIVSAANSVKSLFDSEFPYYAIPIEAHLATDSTCKSENFTNTFSAKDDSGSYLEQPIKNGSSICAYQYQLTKLNQSSNPLTLWTADEIENQLSIIHEMTHGMFWKFPLTPYPVDEPFAKATSYHLSGGIDSVCGLDGKTANSDGGYLYGLCKKYGFDFNHFPAVIDLLFSTEAQWYKALPDLPELPVPNEGQTSEEYNEEYQKYLEKIYEYSRFYASSLIGEAMGIYIPPEDIEI